jgi:hypothetical protein
LMHATFLNDSTLWQLTSNCKIESYQDKFRICLLLRTVRITKEGIAELALATITQHQ